MWRGLRRQPSRPMRDGQKRVSEKQARREKETLSGFALENDSAEPDEHHTQGRVQMRQREIRTRS